MHTSSGGPPSIPSGVRHFSQLIMNKDNEYGPTCGCHFAYPHASVCIMHASTIMHIPPNPCFSPFFNQILRPKRPRSSRCLRLAPRLTPSAKRAHALTRRVARGAYALSLRACAQNAPPSAQTRFCAVLRVCARKSAFYASARKGRDTRRARPKRVHVPCSSKTPGAQNAVFALAPSLCAEEWSCLYIPQRQSPKPSWVLDNVAWNRKQHFFLFFLVACGSKHLCPKPNWALDIVSWAAKPQNQIKIAACNPK